MFKSRPGRQASALTHGWLLNLFSEANGPFPFLLSRTLPILQLPEQYLPNSTCVEMLVVPLLLWHASSLLGRAQGLCGVSCFLCVMGDHGHKGSGRAKSACAVLTEGLDPGLAVS